MNRFALLAAGLLAALPLPALACSPAPGYRVPTNLELAQEAEVVFIGQVIGGTAMEAGASSPPSIRVRPITMLKGALVGDPLVLEGLSLANGQYAVLSNPYDLENAHPLAWAGGCIRHAFPADARVLFFLKRHEGRWGPAGGPFARWAEDALDPGAPWPVLTALYLRAAALPPTERKALLEGERAALLGRAGDPVARLMAADITRQLAGPNKPLRGEIIAAEPEGDGG